MLVTTAIALASVAIFTFAWLLLMEKVRVP